MIPRIFHHIWLGSDPEPDDYVNWLRGLQELHPGWEVKTWTDANLPELSAGAATAYTASRNAGEKSGVLRYELLRVYGGVYVDCDIEFKRPIDELIQDCDVFAAWESPNILCDAVMGGIAGHALFSLLVDELPAWMGHHGKAITPHRTGPLFLTNCVNRLGREEGGITPLPQETFYPYSWYEDASKASQYPNAYCVHHWAGSWAK
jgi:mannosyltransferase OCH1-like enzyme